LSVITNDDGIVDGRLTRRRIRWMSATFTAVLAFAAAAFCWSFALPLLGLAVFVSKFFAG
jgi:hypothetical protein